MAAALFKAQATQSGDAGRYEVSSAGTWALDGEPASPGAQAAMRRRRLDLSAHRGCTITRDLVTASDLIFVMTHNHYDSICAEFPFAREKIHLLSELAGRSYDIADPYGRDEQEYEACAAELGQLIEKGYRRVDEWLATATSRER